MRKKAKTWKDYSTSSRFHAPNLAAQVRRRRRNVATEARPSNPTEAGSGTGDSVKLELSKNTEPFPSEPESYWNVTEVTPAGIVPVIVPSCHTSSGEAVFTMTSASVVE